MMNYMYIIKISYYKIEEHFFRTGRRNAPTFGTHVRIDTLTLKKTNFLTHPTPGGFRGLNCLARLALAREGTPILVIYIFLLIYLQGF